MKYFYFPSSKVETPPAEAGGISQTQLSLSSEDMNLHAAEGGGVSQVQAFSRKKVEVSTRPKSP
jgi:hypothetical protein